MIQTSMHQYLGSECRIFIFYFLAASCAFSSQTPRIPDHGPPQAKRGGEPLFPGFHETQKSTKLFIMSVNHKNKFENYRNNIF